MNEKRLCKSLDALMWFIDESLGIDREKNKLSGFNLIVPFLEASAYNSYIETVSNKSDIIYLRIKESLIGMTEYAYLNYIKKIVSNIKLNEKRVILAFDYTDEDFYGDVQGFNIHGWTGEKGITGKFKFLTCSITYNLFYIIQIGIFSHADQRFFNSQIYDIRFIAYSFNIR